MATIDYEEDSDAIDFNNYKGMFHAEDADHKYQDKITGAHFNYFDLWLRLKQLQKKLQAVEPIKIAVEKKKSVILLQLLRKGRNEGLAQQGYGTTITKQFNIERKTDYSELLTKLHSKFEALKQRTNEQTMENGNYKKFRELYNIIIKYRQKSIEDLLSKKSTKSSLALANSLTARAIKKEKVAPVVPRPFLEMVKSRNKELRTQELQRYITSVKESHESIKLKYESSTRKPIKNIPRQRIFKSLIDITKKFNKKKKVLISANLHSSKNNKNTCTKDIKKIRL